MIQVLLISLHGKTFFRSVVDKLRVPELLSVIHVEAAGAAPEPVTFWSVLASIASLHNTINGLL